MFTILSRYVLRKFMIPFVAAFGGLCILVMFAQVVDRLDRFLAEGVNFGHVLGYLFTSLPFQAINMLPIATLMATLFVVGNLMRTREYVAGLAGGIPPERFLGGILVAGLLISFLSLLINETVVPPSTRYASMVYKKHIQRLGEWKKTVFEDLCVMGADGRIWNAIKFDQGAGKMERAIVNTITNGRMGIQIDAMEALWNKTGWTFKNGVIRTYEPNGISIEKVEKFKEKLFPFPEKPDELEVKEPQPEEMNYQGLKEHIDRLSALGVPVRPLEVELDMKLAFPFTCFMVALLGVPVSLKGRGSVAKGIALGCIIAIIYLGFIQFGKALALRLIPVWMGAWLGNIVFGATALVFWWRFRKSL